jgi:hypothetical protein
VIRGVTGELTGDYLQSAGLLHVQSTCPWDVTVKLQLVQLAICEVRIAVDRCGLLS